MEKFEAIKCFVRVAEVGSFTRAAESLGLPKASVSIAIQQLETRLETQLLHRTTRRVQLTPDGEVFYQRSRDLLADVDELDTLFHASGVDISGRVRVDMSNPLARRLVIPRMPEFFALYPNVDVELSSTERKVDLVSEGFDCVIRTGALVDSGLIVRPLGTLKQVNCASPAYIARYGIPQSLDDLANHQLVHFSLTLGNRHPGWDYQQGDQGLVHKMAGRLTVNNADAYQAACLAGLGMVQTPEIGVRHLLDRGDLIEVLPEYRAAPMPISLVYPNRRNLSKRVRIFMDWLSDIVKDYLAKY